MSVYTLPCALNTSVHEVRPASSRKAHYAPTTAFLNDVKLSRSGSPVLLSIPSKSLPASSLLQPVGSKHRLGSGDGLIGFMVGTSCSKRFGGRPSIKQRLSVATQEPKQPGDTCCAETNHVVSWQAQAMPIALIVFNLRSTSNLRVLSLQPSACLPTFS
eukprot:scaffold295590_cov32-Tisochrysis_lutea.AAC.1